MIEMLKKKSLLFLIGIPYFFCMNHYLGIRNDGILYTLQVFHKWYPERFVNDPPFMFGNQDSFTIFSHVYGFLISLFPINVAAKIVCFGGQFLFAVSILIFLRLVLKKSNQEQWTLPIALLFFSLYVAFSSKTILYFSQLVEAIPVPRTWSVAFGVLGLSALLCNRKWLSVVSFIAGVLFHPLMAGWGLPLWLFYFFPKTRIPVVVVSALIPFTAFINQVPFASYPDDWGYKPAACGPEAAYCLRFAMYILFCSVFLKRFNDNSYLNHFCKSLLFVLCIAFYWYVWTGLNYHILLYQIQPWRVEWLSIVAMIPLFVHVVMKTIERYKEKSELTTWMFAVPCMALTLFSDTHFMECMIFGAVLLLRPEKKVNRNHFMILCSVILILNILVSGGRDLFTMGVEWLTLFKYKYWGLLCSRLVMMTVALSIVYGIYAVAHKQYFRAVPLLVYVFFPQFMVLPFVGVLWEKLKKWQIALLLVVAIFDGVSGKILRDSSIILSASEHTQLSYFVPIAVFFCILYVLCRWKPQLKWLAFSPIVWLVPSAYAHYDIRLIDQKNEEAGLEQFRDETIFPVIKDRDKMLFVVSGFMKNDSRLQFLTGNYFDYQTTVGEVFFKGQHQTAVHRASSIMFKDNRGFRNVVERNSMLNAMFSSLLADKDTLIDRTDYLCEKNEIEYLVSDLNEVPFDKKDSVFVNGSSKYVYLYACEK